MEVLPAQAGVILFNTYNSGNEAGTPRASGGDPRRRNTCNHMDTYSPRKRG